jgi:subtilisin family serine protease
MFVSNEDAFPDGFLEQQQIHRPNAFVETAHIGGVSGHGTKMATIAAGKIHGVAPNANLYLMKILGQWNLGTSTTRPNQNYAVQPKALLKVLDEIQQHVESRLGSNQDAKSVINMSWGMYFPVICLQYSGLQYSGLQYSG